MASNTLLVVAFIALLSVAVVNGAGLEFDPTNAQYLYSIGRPYEGVAFQSPMDITTNSVGDWVFFDGIANRVIVLDHTNLTKIQLLFGYNGLTQPGVFGNARALTIGKGGVDNDFFIVADSIRIQIFNALGVYQRELNTYQIASERENINTDNSRFKSNSIDILPDSGLFYSNGPVLAIVDLSQDETESYLEIYNYHGATNDAPIVRRTHTELGLSVPILCAKFDGYGNIWVLTTLALHRFPLQSSGVISLTSDMTIALQLNTDNPSMFTIHPTNRNMYYATSASGIRTFTYSSGSFTPGTVSPGSAYISSPRAVALLPTGYVVASLGSSSLFVFSLTYFSQQIRGQPAGDGQFSTIQGVCIHKASGTVVVADATNNNLQVFTKTGTWLNAYSNPSYFNNPVHCSFDGDHIYVDMQAISYVYRWDFSLSGNIAHFDNAIYYKVKQSSNGAAMCNGLLVVSSSAKPTAYISSYRSTSIGTAVDTPLNQIALSVSSQPYGITCDNTYIYAANAGGGIIRLTMNPTTGAFTIVNDAYAVSLSNPYGVAVDSDFLYATESTRQKMSIFAVTPGSPTPRLHDFGTPGTGPSYFARPYHLALHQNYMFIVNNGNARVDVFCTQLAPEVKTSLFVLFVGEPFEEVVLDVTGSFQRYFINAIGTWPEGVTADYTTNLVVNDTVSLMGNATTAGKYQFHIGISDPNNCSSAPVLLNVTILEAPGVITNYSPKNITTEGNVLVTLTGRYPNADLLAIMPDLVVTAFIGDKPCTGLIFLSDTQATCTVAAGYGDLNVIKMNYFSAVPAFNKDISYKYFAYGAPVIDTVDMGDSIVTAGGIAITLHGAFFGAIGAPVEIRIAGLLCTAPQTNVAHTEVTCIAPIGVGDKSLVNITVGDSTYGKLSGTKRVVYEQVNFDCSQLQVSAGPSTDGGHLLSICGANFGESELNVTSAGTWTGTRTVMVRDKVCRIEYIDNDLVVCRLPPGTGAYNSVKINFNHINWIKTGINVAYAAPQITEVSPPESLKTGSTLTVFGYNFGFNTPDAPRSITIGTDATCENIVLIGNDMLTCVVNGGRGSNQPLVLWVDGQTHSNSYTVDYILQSTTGLACLPPTGAQDPLSNDHTICNCYSGYQPADEANTQCVPPQDKKRSTNLETCPGKVLKLHQEGQFPPHRPIVRFHNDRVYIEQKSSVVHGRRESYLYFMSPNMTTFDPNRKNRRSEFTCEFPGHLWTKTVDSLDCNDVWSGQIPWSQHDMCGWDMISLPTSHIIEYATELNHQYRDVIKAPGVYHQSVHRVSYLLKVTFKRELQVVSGAFSVFFPEVESSPIDVVITSALLYDPALEHIVFTFRTTMNYPYMINPGTTLNGVYAPDATAATLYAVYNDAGDAECDPLQPHTDCEQEWHAVLEVAAGTCLLDGQLIFNTSTLLCRDSEGPAACPTTGFYQTSFILTADNIRVCDTTELDATEDTTIAISSYADAAFSTPNNAFQVGDFVYFRVVINSADATIDKIILTNVVIAPNRPNEEVVLDGTGVQVDASFTYTNVTQANSPVWPIAPGKNTGVAFSFRLTRSGLNSISSINGGDSYAELEIQATVDITYHGNSKKRSMTASSNSFESLTESAHLRVVSINYDEEEVEAIVEQAVETEDDAFGAFWANDAANYKQTTTTVLFGVLLAAFMLAL